jgi:DNA-binding CsgD family transcriptional regulator
VQTLEDARAACDRSRWGDAWRLLAALDLEALEADDLDRRATAAFLTGQHQDAFDAWTLAHQRCLDEGAVHRAAHLGARIGEALGFMGDIPRCRGWVDRSADLLDRAGIDCVEQGYLEHGLGFLRVFEAGDLAGAHAHFVQAGKIAARYAHRELATLAAIAEGRMLIYLGDLAEGMALLDGALVSIEAGDLSPLATGDAYCTAIDACSELFDLERCRAWTDSFTRWCADQQELVLYRGHCFMHRAEVTGLLGRWPEALEEARHACVHLAEPVHPMALAAASLIEGDLLRLLDDRDGAEASYRRASEHGRDPQPGLALLRVAQGRLDAGDAAIRRALGEAQDPMTRARLLGPYVEIVLEGGDVDAARPAAEELVSIASMFSTGLLMALARRAMGAVLLAEGDAAAALVELRAACNELNRLGVVHDGARARLLLSTACAALGDHDTAELERAAAEAALASLRPAPAPRGAGDLTDREVEVLVLLAGGKTNRVIAQELFISEKTVASHVSHIFTKLGLTSRSAATAYAYDHGLTGGRRGGTP